MKYDIIHFEALGEELSHLEELTEKAIEEGSLPKDLKYLCTPLTVQKFLESNKIELPNIISTKTHSILPQEYYTKGQKKSVLTRSAGYDHFEALQDQINLASLREYCVDAVAQTAIKFLFCTCGNLNEYNLNTLKFERKDTNSFRELNEDVIVAVYGVGKIGSKTYDYTRKIGVTSIAVDLREDELRETTAYKDFVFVTPEEAIAKADIIINTMNLTKNPESRFYNMGYFNEEYLSNATKPLIFINVTRGEIAPESTILKLYKEGKIVGVATDVFSHEAELTECLRNDDFSLTNDADVLAGKDIIDLAISRKANFYVQPHQGFNSDLAAWTKAQEAMRHIIYWFKNGKKGFKEQLPYYH